jgi:hypothetical protein
LKSSTEGNATAMQNCGHKADFSTLFNNFELVSIVNLPDRVDRRRQMESQLYKLGVAPTAGHLEFFPAIRVATLDDWPSLGARGCFLSHYAILKRARDRHMRNILIMEDDCEFAPITRAFEHQIVTALGESPWDIVYLGHREQLGVFGPVSLVPWPQPVICAHLYAINGNILDRLVDFLEQVMRRPEGHPQGGPQHYDGALTMFRAQNKDVITLLAAPSIAGQRSSRSDVSIRWFDQVPGLRTAINGLRTIRHRVR